MKDTPDYKDAIGEIESIVEEIESESVDVDVLAEKVKRAAYLIKMCKAKLKKGYLKQIANDISKHIKKHLTILIKKD